MATGGLLLTGAFTVIVTLDGLLFTRPSFTTSWNVSVAGPVGAVKVGLTAVVLDKVTVGPAVWLQA